LSCIISSGLTFSKVPSTHLNNADKSKGIPACAASNPIFFNAIASSLLLSTSSKLEELASIFMSYLFKESWNASLFILKNFQSSILFKVKSLSIFSKVQSNILYHNSCTHISKFFLSSAITELDSKKLIFAPVAVFVRAVCHCGCVTSVV
jgi:hypothetical protein